MAEQRERTRRRLDGDPRSDGADPDISAYANNPLIDACGPILSAKELTRMLIHIPSVPVVDEIRRPGHLLDHAVGDIWRMHMPTAEGIQVAQNMDFMLRQGYVHRRPGTAATNRLLHGRPAMGNAAAAVQLATAVGGIPGAGKSEAIFRALNLKPQVAVHPQFPGMAGPLLQLLWLKLDVPESGRMHDLAGALFRATDEALGTDFSEIFLGGRHRSGAALAAEWVRKVRSNFLGILVLDEVQNLFKIATKAIRTKKSTRDDGGRPELGIQDDQALKFVLTLTNTSKIPVVVAGTPDGIGALMTRMSTSQRISTAGYYEIPYAVTADDPYFSKYFFPTLWSCQYLPERLENTDELRRAVHRLSGGVARMAVALWIHGQKLANGRGAKRMEIADLQAASDGPLRLNQPAIAALLSQDPQRMSRYQDLLPRSVL